MNVNSNFELNFRWPFQCRRNNIVAFVLLFMVTFLIYSNSFHASWHYDDFINIVDNGGIKIKNFSWPEIEKSFHALSEIEKSLYGSVKSGGMWSRPISYFSFAINYYLDGSNVYGYHVINFSIHYLCSVFLFLFIYHMLKLPLLAGRYGEYAYSAALLSAVFWAIHPIHVTAVTYIVQRMASLVTLFYILTMYFYLKGRTSTAIYRAAIFYSLGFGSFILAFGSKQNAVMLPVSIVLFDLYFIQGISREHMLRAAKILAAFMICALIALFFYLKLDPSTIDYSCRTFGMTERLLTQPRVLLYYLSLLLYPLSSRLMLVHDFDISASLFDPWTTCIALAALVLILGITVFAAKKIPLISYCVLFFFINHLIEGSFFSLELVYEHRNYLPSMLLPLPIAIGLLNMLDFFEKKKMVFISLVTAIPTMMIVLGVTTFMYNDVFRNDLTLWYDNANKAPRLQIPHHNLGLAYLEAGRLPESYEECLKALQSEHTGNIANKYRTYIVLMQYYIAAGDLTKSLNYADKALHYFPNIADLYYVKGIILLERKGPDEAESFLRKAIELKPNDARFYCGLGTVLLKKGDYEGAIDQAKHALHLTPESWQAYSLLSNVFIEKEGQQRIANHFFQVNRRIQFELANNRRL